MQLSSVINTDRVLEHLSILPIIISIVGLCVPYSLPLFSLSVFMYVIVCIALVDSKTEILQCFSKSRIHFSLLLVFIMTLVAIMNGYIQNGGLSEHAKIYLLRSLAIITYLSFLQLSIRCRFGAWLSLLSNSVFFTTGLIAITSLGKFVSVFFNYTFLESSFEKSIHGALQWNYYTSSLTNDYNMFAYGISLGVLSFQHLKEKSKISWLVISTMILSVVLSGSRRGILFILFWVIINIIISVKRKKIVSIFYFILLLVSLSPIFVVTQHLFKLDLSKISLNQSLFVTFAPSPAYRALTIPFQGWQLEDLSINVSRQYFNSKEAPKQQEYKISPSDGGRIFIWKQSIESYFKDTNLIKKILGNSFDYKIKKGDPSFHPHNIFISALLSQGLAGLACLCYCLGHCLINLFKPENSRMILLQPFLLGFFFLSLTSGDCFFSPTIFSLTCGAILYDA